MDPDLDPDPIPVRTLLTIDWNHLDLSTEAAALAAWAQIAPTGADWDAKLEEVPITASRPLAIALLRAGSFACTAPAPVAACVRPSTDVEPPVPSAGMADPCLRRMLALWSIAALEPDDLPRVHDALKAIAALPPPESQLVAAAILAIPEDDHAARLELLAIAARAGQRELASGMVGTLDEPHLIEAATRHHLAGALEVLSADHHRAVYLAAIADDALAPAARGTAISELLATDTDGIAPDLKQALITATKAKDCSVAAAAARALEARGDRRFVPRRPRARGTAAMMRALCVLASYERLQGNDEDSLLATFVPPKGLERIIVAFDPLADVDTDGDGDPRTDRTAVLVPRTEVVVPEIEDLVRAFAACTGTTCNSPDREFRFGLKTVGGQAYLARLEIIEKPPCTTH